MPLCGTRAIGVFLKNGRIGHVNNYRLDRRDALPLDVIVTTGPKSGPVKKIILEKDEKK